MKGKRHREEQVTAILKQGEAGLTSTELRCQHGPSRPFTAEKQSTQITKAWTVAKPSD
jgi:hypothetical protein